MCILIILLELIINLCLDEKPNNNFMKLSNMCHIISSILTSLKEWWMIEILNSLLYKYSLIFEWILKGLFDNDDDE